MSHAPDPAASAPRYELHLFIAGASPHSARAVRHLKSICEEYLPGRYELLIVDIHQQPDRAQQEQLVAAPTLIRRWPLPVRRLVGDLSDRPRVLAALGLTSADDAPLDPPHHG